MYRKILLTFCIFSLLIISLCTYSIAATEGTNKVKNAVMNTGNMIGNTATSAANGVMNMTEDMVNGAATLGNDTVNGLEKMGQDAGNTVGYTSNTLENGDNNYDATRTATTNDNLFGLSNNAWTWIILGIIAAIIVSLVWYYGAQYEHRTYDND